MVISSGTVISSLFSDFLTSRLGVGRVVCISIALTTTALFGFSISNHFTSLCLWAIPYGLGAGAVDAALNNYVALRFSSRHMIWMHCSWGIGASISPLIMSYCLTSTWGWHAGYRIVAMIQAGITILIMISLPLWKRRGIDDKDKYVAVKAITPIQAIKVRGAPSR